MATVFRRAGFAAIVSFVFISGCQNTPSVRGKVIAGNLSFIAVVDQGDERLKADGLAGVDVGARAGVGRGGGFVVADTQTDEKGNFTLKFKDHSAFIKPVEFVADAAGFQSARAEMVVPPPDRRLLIILVPGREGGGVGTAPGTR